MKIKAGFYQVRRSGKVDDIQFELEVPNDYFERLMRAAFELNPPRTRVIVCGANVLRIFEGARKAGNTNKKED